MAQAFEFVWVLGNHDRRRVASRLGLAQAWRILVGVEMLAAVPWGLGWMIFGAREFLNTDVMLAGVAVIGVIGLGLEKLVFQRLERFTVIRWGMMT
jgi:NitT/TauT family transport system permease protein